MFRYRVRSESGRYDRPHDSCDAEMAVLEAQRSGLPGSGEELTATLMSVLLQTFEVRVFGDRGFQRTVQVPEQNAETACLIAMIRLRPCATPGEVLQAEAKLVDIA